MREPLAALVSGLLFGVGLVVSGMTQPAKVIGFLDFGGRWDASLLIVLMTAVSVYFVGLRFAKRHRRARLRLPTRNDIDSPLVAGAVLFGVGWGLAGYCPGASLAAAGGAGAPALTFVGSMLVGMAVHHVVVTRRVFHGLLQRTADRA